MGKLGIELATWSCTFGGSVAPPKLMSALDDMGCSAGRADTSKVSVKLSLGLQLYLQGESVELRAYREQLQSLDHDVWFEGFVKGLVPGTIPHNKNVLRDLRILNGR